MSTKYETFGEVSIILESQETRIEKHDKQIGDLILCTRELLSVQSLNDRRLKWFVGISTSIILILIGVLVKSQTQFLDDYRELIRESGNRGTNKPNSQNNERNLQPTNNEAVSQIKPLVQTDIKQNEIFIHFNGLLYYPN